jgi:hypothetical protein
MTRVSIGFVGFVDEAGAALELSPAGTVPLAGTEPVLFSEVSGVGLVVAELAAEVKRSVRGGWLF